MRSPAGTASGARLCEPAGRNGAGTRAGARRDAAPKSENGPLGGLFDEFDWTQLFNFLLQIIPMFNCGAANGPDRALAIMADKGRGFLRLRNATVAKLREQYPKATPREIHQLAKEIVSCCDDCTPEEIEAFAENSTMPNFDL